MSVALASYGRAYTKPSLRIVNDNQRLCRVFHLKISSWDDHRLVSWPVNAPDTSNDLSFVYDYSDQPTSVSGKASGSYRYDGHLKRVKAVVDNKTIYNVYNIAGELVHVHELTGDKKTDYVRLGGQTVARVRGVTGGSTSANITYVYNDHLGSPVATKTGSAAIIRERYTPFGITTNNPADLDDQAGFTGHIKDKATGLNYMQARYYDPVIGRFLSVDPVTFMQTGDPRFFNRYAYAFNDPTNLTDPTGECPICPVILGAIWLADKAYGAYDAAQTAKGVANGDISAAEAAVSQAASQAGGALGGPVGRIAAKKATKAAKAAKKTGNTPPSMPSSKVADGNGVKITHKFKSGDHPPAHMHVDGGGASTKIGPNGKPIKGSPELSGTQQKVVDQNKSAIRKTGRKLGKILKHEENK